MPTVSNNNFIEAYRFGNLPLLGGFLCIGHLGHRQPRTPPTQIQFVQGVPHCAWAQAHLQILSDDNQEHGDGPKGSQVTFFLGIVLKKFANRPLDLLPNFPGATAARFIVQPRRPFPIEALDPKADRDPGGFKEPGNLGIL